MRQRTRKPIPERFWAKVDKDGPVPEHRPNLGPCWLWTAATLWGYGIFTIAKHQPAKAHRVAYELEIGPVPDGLTLDHLCRVRRCVRPSHLEPTTMRENTLRGVGITASNARKTHCKRGHPFNAANTYVNPRGQRSCRPCMAQLQQKYRRKARDGKPGAD